VMTALGLLVVLLVLLAALRTTGWRIPALSASIAAGASVFSCLLARSRQRGAKAMRGLGR
jgi:hypothetical protein